MIILVGRWSPTSPKQIRVGVVKVGVSGTKIELWDKDGYREYLATADPGRSNIANEYGGNPYAYLVELAKIAQKDGVIKGILLHQGESNAEDKDWPRKVKLVYDNLMNDLNLKPESVPLLAGEVVNADQGGEKASANEIIKRLPETLHNSYVISSAGLPCNADHLHFTAEGYRQFGKRYAEKMLRFGYKVNETKLPAASTGAWLPRPIRLGPSHFRRSTSPAISTTSAARASRTISSPRRRGTS